MSSARVTIGYSCWGFLGDGIVDTPDGGRSHRVTLLESLIQDQGCSIWMLQQNRDLVEADKSIEIENIHFTNDLPDVDFVFLEYRWPITGRNVGVEKTNPNYTPDLDRQNEIIRHYADRGTPLLIWDKDQQLDTLPNELLNSPVAVFEPSLKPKKDRTSLLFPANTAKLKRALQSLKAYSQSNRSIDLVYIGNQYDRDQSLQKYYLSSELDGISRNIYGKWKANTLPSSLAQFGGRIGYKEVSGLYAQSLCNILIAPNRYYKNGQFTQRIFESLWELCIPLVPEEYQCKEYLFPKELWVRDAKDVRRVVQELKRMNNSEISALLEKIIANIDHYYSPIRQTSIIMQSYRKFAL